MKPTTNLYIEHVYIAPARAEKHSSTAHPFLERSLKPLTC